MGILSEYRYKILNFTKGSWKMLENKKLAVFFIHFCYVFGLYFATANQRKNDWKKAAVTREERVYALLKE